MLNAISISSLNSSQDALSKSIRQLSSGLRINSAADDAAGASVLVSLSAQATGLLQAAQNANNSASLVDTASSAIGQVGDTLQQMRTLAVQAGDGALSASDRQSIQGQIGQLSQQLDQVAGQSQFNGQNLLNGSFSANSSTTGGAGPSIALADLSGNALGVSGLDVSTATGASSALTAIDSALSTVSSQQSQLGAASAALSSEQSNAVTSAENTLASKSRIADTDYAAASANLAQNNVLSQAALKAVSMYNAIQKQTITALLS